MKADLAIYTHVLGVPGQYKSVALMLNHKMNFYCCANRDGFCKFSHKYKIQEHREVFLPRKTFVATCSYLKVDEIKVWDGSLTSCVT